MSLRRGGVAAIVLGLWIAPEAFGGAWTPDRGAAYTKFAVHRFTSEQEFDADGDILPFDFEGRYTDRNLRLYGEYGLRDGLTLIASIPIQSVDYKNRFESGDTEGLGDFDLGVRLRLIERSAVFSFQGLVKVPGWYEGNPRLPLGNDQFDVEGRFLVGQSLLRGRLYYGVEAGYRWRDREPSDEWRYQLELGGHMTTRLYGRTKLEAIASAHNADDVRDVFGNPVLRFESELRRIETTLGYRFARATSIEVAWNPIFWGRNTAKGTTWTVALIWARPGAEARNRLQALPPPR